MGYYTDFEGVLKFGPDFTLAGLKELRKFLGEDCRDHPEWGGKDLTFIDLKLEEDLSGLSWNGSEKTYDLVDKVNLVTGNMRQAGHTNFRFHGQLMAQGGDIEDRWVLSINEFGVACRKNIGPPEGIVKCPDCGHEFVNAESVTP